MTIEIRRPELEAPLRQTMERGCYRDVENVLMQALASLTFQEVQAEPSGSGLRTGANLIEALQSSPYRELPIEPERCRLPVREIVL